MLRATHRCKQGANRRVEGSRSAQYNRVNAQPSPDSVVGLFVLGTTKDKC
jgi:hypothetical protein